MSFVEAFLIMTAFAYLACMFFTLVGKPPLFKVNTHSQIIFYFIAFITLLFSVVPLPFSIPWPSEVYFLLGALYSFATVGSFIGYPQRWMAYWRIIPEKGSDAGQIGMAFWDLAVSISFFYLSFG